MPEKSHLTSEANDYFGLVLKEFKNKSQKNQANLKYVTHCQKKVLDSSKEYNRSKHSIV